MGLRLYLTMSITIKLLTDEIIRRNELLSLKGKAVPLHDLTTWWSGDIAPLFLTSAVGGRE